jgi:hypothetical protein
MTDGLSFPGPNTCWKVHSLRNSFHVCFYLTMQHSIIRGSVRWSTRYLTWQSAWTSIVNLRLSIIAFHHHRLYLEKYWKLWCICNFFHGSELSAMNFVLCFDSIMQGQCVLEKAYSISAQWIFITNSGLTNDAVACRIFDSARGIFQHDKAPKFFFQSW